MTSWSRGQTHIYVTSKKMTDEKPIQLTLHLKVKEAVMQTYDGAAPVAVTACGWVNPPEDRVVYDIVDTTCIMCLDNVY